MGSVKAVGRFGNTVVNDGQGCIGSVFQRNRQSLFFHGREGGKHPIRQVVIGIGLCAHTDLDPGELLAAHFLNDGFDSVVSAGRAVCTDTQPTRRQGNIVKHNDDPLGRDVEVGTQLQDAAAGQIHIGLGLQQEYLLAGVGSLAVQALVLEPIDLAAQILGQKIYSAEALLNDLSRMISAPQVVYPAGPAMTKNINESKKVYEE